MKRGVVLLLIFILSINFVLADTTFFEGDLGYRDDFIMGNTLGGVIPVNLPETLGGRRNESKPITEIFVEDTEEFITKEEINKTIVCPLISDSLKKHIKEKRNIEYSEEDIEILTVEINQEFKINISNNEVRDIINNYEDTCDSYFPILGGLAIGRSRDLLTFFVMVITLMVLIFIIYIANRAKSALKNTKKFRGKKK